VVKGSSIDRYIRLQSSELRTQDELENHRRNMEVLRRSLDRTQTQLIQEIQEVDQLLEKQNAYSLEKKRLFHAMSVEDDHEVELWHERGNR
jgi:hypothetical protein